MSARVSLRRPTQLPQITTERLILRPPVAADCKAIATLANDFEVTRWLGRLPFPYTIQDARHFVEEIAPREATWAIRRSDDDVLIGMIGVHDASEEAAPELGYWLGRPHWGSGYATEAGRAVVDFAFAGLGFELIASGYFEGNERSAAVLGKLGFERTGTSRRHALACGTDVAHVDMVLRTSG